jgi:hypothetical protein
MAIHLRGPLITCSGGVRRFKVGLDFAWSTHALAGCPTEALVGSDNTGCFGTFALKTSCRKVQFQAIACISRGVCPEACILCSPNVFGVPSTPGALCAVPGAALAFCYIVR